MKVGYSCNNFCKHCVQGEKRYKLKNKTTQEIKGELEHAYSKKIRELVFTGGEASIRPDIVELVGHASKLGFKTIQVQTNGRMFASKKFADAMIEAGMNEFSPALNGHLPELHDFLSSVPGAWKQTVQGIKNIREYDIQIVTNTVVSKPNYRFMSRIAELLIGLGVNQYQLAFVHPAGRAWDDFDSIVPFVSLAAPHIHKGLQVGMDASIKTMAEAMPFCQMKGYEQQVSEFYIPPSDVYESGFKIEKWENWRKTEGKWKGESCKDCAFYDLCEGPWIEYVKKRGAEEFVPILGKRKTIKDIFKTQ
ncbi:MAG: radical SAM protein [Candidatus Altiarchaeota archaeon]|nr:radical SAM protein [Candidatus Altiarchaeota archaeon]